MYIVVRFSTSKDTISFVVCTEIDLGFVFAIKTMAQLVYDILFVRICIWVGNLGCIQKFNVSYCVGGTRFDDC